MLVSAIIDELVNEVGGDTGDDDFVEKMLGFFKSGLRRLPVFMRDRLFVTESSLTLSANAITLDLSNLDPGFVKERAVWYVNGDGKRVPITMCESQEQFDAFYTPNAPGNPLYYKIYGKTMRFNCKAATALTVGFDYFKEVSDVEEGDTFFGNEQTVEAAKEMTKVIYYQGYEEDTGKADKARLDAGALISQLESDYAAQEQGGYIEEKE